ncbi:hypothetical protein HFP72_04920 [Nocardiopsis sp. ARC36]
MPITSGARCSSTAPASTSDPSVVMGVSPAGAGSMSSASVRTCSRASVNSSSRAG